MIMISVLALGAIGCVQGHAAAVAGPPLEGRFSGVNFAGGEFAAGHIPGRYGYDYAYPDAQTVAPFRKAGFTAARLPFRWERLQPQPMQGLDKAELARLDQALNALTGFQTIILDAHNYARFAHQRLDHPPASGAWLADLWSRLATRYAHDPRIAFGIMNEPNGITATDWRRIADQTVAAIRRTGAKNLILVPGTNWSGAHSWTQTGLFGNGSADNATAMAGFHDPGNNFAFELHQYLDQDSSGAHQQCIDPTDNAERLTAVTEWLRQEHARGVLAEFGAADNPQCLSSLDALLTALNKAPDVWLGWTYWAAGDRWHNYMFSIQPHSGYNNPQMAVLLRHLPQQHSTDYRVLKHDRKSND